MRSCAGKQTQSTQLAVCLFACFSGKEPSYDEGYHMSLRELSRPYSKREATLKVKCIEKKKTYGIAGCDSYPGHHDEAVQYTSNCGTVGR